MAGFGCKRSVHGDEVRLAEQRLEIRLEHSVPLEHLRLEVGVVGRYSQQHPLRHPRHTPRYVSESHQPQRLVLQAVHGLDGSFALRPYSLFNA